MMLQTRVTIYQGLMWGILLIGTLVITLPLDSTLAAPQEGQEYTIHKLHGCFHVSQPSTSYHDTNTVEGEATLAYNSAEPYCQQSFQSFAAVAYLHVAVIPLTGTSAAGRLFSAPNIPISITQDTWSIRMKYKIWADWIAYDLNDPACARQMAIPFRIILTVYMYEQGKLPDFRGQQSLARIPPSPEEVSFQHLPSHVMGNDPTRVFATKQQPYEAVKLIEFVRV